jgi:DNA-directed RNA polymerase specialized sigma24 family protein
MREYTAATGPAAAADDGETARRAAAFAELYRTRNRQLVAYATSLAGDALAAEDLVAQAHFRVWRQLRAGQELENVPTHLTTTLRTLAAGLERAQGDIDAVTADLAAGRDTGAQDPEQHARQVALLARRIKQLPDRWVGALWHADAEDLPMHAIGARIGADEATAALVVGRAREQLRETFLRAQPGTAPSEACAEYWALLPSIVHGTATARKTRQFGQHAAAVGDIRHDGGRCGPGRRACAAVRRAPRPGQAGSRRPQR